MFLFCLFLFLEQVLQLVEFFLVELVEDHWVAFQTFQFRKIVGIEVAFLCILLQMRDLLVWIVLLRLLLLGQEGRHRLLLGRRVQIVPVRALFEEDCPILIGEIREPFCGSLFHFRALSLVCAGVRAGQSWRLETTAGHRRARRRPVGLQRSFARATRSTVLLQVALIRCWKI